jgi:SAM-dependent methyltransferase
MKSKFLTSVQGKEKSIEKLQYTSSMALRVSWFLTNLVYRQISVFNNTKASSSLLQSVAKTFAKQVLPISLSSYNSSQNSQIKSRSIEEISQITDINQLTENDWTILREEFFTAFFNLISKDWENIETGQYRLPYDLIPNVVQRQWNPFEIFQTTKDFYNDAYFIRQRQLNKDGLEVRRNHNNYNNDNMNYPDYYVQNFHYQSDGYLSSASARRYDYQVESLFLGCADCMRRQLLPPLLQQIQSKTKMIEENNDNNYNDRYCHLDIASGTGRFLTFLLDNLPLTTTTTTKDNKKQIQSIDELTLVELSPYYLNEAKRNIAEYYTFIRPKQRREQQQSSLSSSYDRSEQPKIHYIQGAIESLSTIHNNNNNNNNNVDTPNTSTSTSTPNPPLKDGSFDSISMIYLFHELPRDIRIQIVAFLARLLKPGGRIYFLDSVQRSDHISYTPILSLFSGNYHEPYYEDYIAHNLTELFQHYNLTVLQEDVHWLSKSLIVEKPM